MRALPAFYGSCEETPKALLGSFLFISAGKPCRTDRRYTKGGIAVFEMLLREMTLIMAQVHQSIMRLNDGFELSLGDKDWHFIVMALLAMALFFVVHAVFARLAKWSITAVSFIYVFTVMTVLGFAIEIGQRISGTGEMDFGDVVAGLYGVLAFFAAYTVCRLAALLVQSLMARIRGKRKKK